MIPLTRCRPACYALLIFLFGCVSAPKPVEPLPVENFGESRSTPNRVGAYNQISIGELHRELRFPEGQRMGLGYVEKPFNSCEVKANHSLKPLCKTMYAGRLDFHMTCRNNKGIVQSRNLLPLEVKGMVWKTGKNRGAFDTDATGRGTIRFVSNRSVRFQPMKFYIGPKIVYKRLKDNWKIVLPRDWCPSL